VVVLEPYRPSPRSSPLPSPVHPRHPSGTPSLHPPHPLSQQHSPATAYSHYPHRPHDQGQATGLEPHLHPSSADPHAGLYTMEDHPHLADGLDWSLEGQTFQDFYPTHHQLAQTTAGWEQAAYPASPAGSAHSHLSTAGTAMAESSGQAGTTTIHFPSGRHPSPPSSSSTLGSELSRAPMMTTHGHARAASAPVTMNMEPNHGLSLDVSHSWSSATTNHSMSAHPDLEPYDYYQYHQQQQQQHQEHPHREPSYEVEEDRPVLLHPPGSSLAPPHSPSGTTADPALSYSLQLAAQQQQQLRAVQDHHAHAQMELDMEHRWRQREQEERELLQMQELAETYHPVYDFTLQAPPPPHSPAHGAHHPPSHDPRHLQPPALTRTALPPPLPPLAMRAYHQPSGTDGAISPPAHSPQAPAHFGAEAGHRHHLVAMQAGFEMGSYFAQPQSPLAPHGMPRAGMNAFASGAFMLSPHTHVHSPAPLLSLE
jgi:hypothetical protein